MPLQHELPDGYLHVRWVREGSIQVVDRNLAASFVLTPEEILDWPVRAVEALDPDALQTIFALQPELVLLGTGSRQIFPSQQILAAFLTRGIGVEAMDNAAAARTFNLLAAEGRRVVAGFIFP